MGIRLIIEEKSYPMELADIMRLQTKTEMFRHYGISAKLSAKMTVFASGDVITSSKLWKIQNFLADKYGLNCNKTKAEFMEVITKVERYWEVQRFFQAYTIIKGETMEYCDTRKNLLRLLLELTGHNKARAKVMIKQFNQTWPQDQAWPSDVLWDFLKTAIKGGDDIDTTNYSE